MSSSSFSCSSFHTVRRSNLGACLCGGEEGKSREHKPEGPVAAKQSECREAGPPLQEHTRGVEAQQGDTDVFSI